MISRRPPSLSALFYARSVDRGIASDYVHWATAMLEQGHDSKNLRMLAGLDSDNTLEAQEHFQRVIRELGLSEPDSRTAMRAYACELAQQLATGTIDPPTGVRRLYDICVQSGYTHEFKIWFELDDALSSLDYGHYPWCYPTLTRDNQSEVIRQEAIKFRGDFWL